MPKEALSKIAGKKRERIFRKAAAEFARHGYHKANINSIARGAGIGKGSIYLYFTDKRDLYYSTFKEAVRIHNDIFDLVEAMDLDPISKIRSVFEQSLSVFPRYRSMYKMYFDLSASGDGKFLAELAQFLEKRSAEFFTRVLTDGIVSGTIRKDIPVEHAAYVIDCVYSLFFASLASQYQRERFRVFTKDKISHNTDLVQSHLRGILNVLEEGITAKRDRRQSGCGRRARPGSHKKQGRSERPGGRRQ